MSDLNIPRGRLPFVIAILVAMVGGAVAVGIAFHRVAGPESAAALPAPLPSTTPTASASATPTASTIPFADCTGITFGPPLAPLNPPADVHKYSAVPPMTIDTTKLYLLTITTSRGTIGVCLQPDLAPNTVNVIVTLARNHFYDGLKFHRVVPEFVIQGGDPKGTGSGGPGYQFDDEPVQGEYTLGAVAMANAGPNTNGSQFFICIDDCTRKLAPSYNLFGYVIEGIDVAQATEVGDVMQKVEIEERDR